MGIQNIAMKSGGERATQSRSKANTAANICMVGEGVVGILFVSVIVMTFLHLKGERTTRENFLPMKVPLSWHPTTVRLHVEPEINMLAQHKPLQVLGRTCEYIHTYKKHVNLIVEVCEGKRGIVDGVV